MQPVDPEDRQDFYDMYGRPYPDYEVTKEGCLSTLLWSIGCLIALGVIVYFLPIWSN